MTNLEKLKTELNKMSLGEFVETVSGPPWCSAMAPECEAHTTCVRCGKTWAEREYKKPMPKLKIGMFVKVDNGFSTQLGIIVYNKEIRDLAVAYKNGGYGYLHCVTVEAVYDAMGFDDCTGNNAIWRKDF